MNTLLMFILADPDAGGGAFTSLFFLAAIFFVFYFFIIRPQHNKQKEIQNKVSEMRKGDKVVSSGGVVGTVHTIEDKSILLEVDKDVKIKLLKSAIADVNPEN